MTTGPHYTVLARRFRPQAFDDVVGQEHVSRALRNAIRSGRVAHAYLFTGARGVGKTSTARILAKALNCPSVQDGVPCNQCEICEGITAGNDVDVLEIDGASNRGIDDIRSLRANVGVRSMRTRYKVYIIDEVHMLTREAFNALLKTLEEPPPNVKFVFCTTEPNKVPDTILSRCQRFDFSAIGEQSIAQRLREIAVAEGFQVDEEALDLVARRARGSMRDSQSLFDQLLAFSDGTVTGDDVHRMLGTASDERLVEIFAAAVEHRPGQVLELLEKSLEAGVQAGELLDQSIAYVRDLMVVLCSGGIVPLSSVSSRHRPVLQNQAAGLGIHSIMAAFQVLAEARNQMFRSTFGRAILEMALLQVSLLENLTAISDLLSGRLPALPDLPSSVSGTTNSPAAAAVSSLAPSPHAPAENDATTEKKNDKTLVEADSHTTRPLIDAPPEIVLTDATTELLMMKLIERLPFGVGGGLKQATGLVLSGVNRIEVLLDATAEFARKSLDTPDVRQKIEAEIRLLTGRDLTLAVRTTSRFAAPSASPAAPPAAATSASVAAEPPRPAAPDRAMSQTVAGMPSPAASEDANGSADPSVRTASPGISTEATAVPGTPAIRRLAPESSSSRSSRSGAATAKPSSPPINLIGEVDAAQDPFVRHVMETFGATVVRVMPAPAATTTESEEAT